jgi:O-antigen/teichoic acid export membrane protein
MGIIIKQSIKSTIYAYIGAVVGFVNVALLMPKLLSTEEIGLINLIFAFVLIGSQFTGLGFGNITNRIFPYFRNSNKNHHGFFTLGLLVSMAGVVLSVVLYFALKKQMIAGNNDYVMLEDYIFYVLPLTAITIFLNYFDNFFRALFNAAVGVFLKEILTKLLITVSIITYFLEWTSFSEFVFLYFLAYSLPAFILAFLLLINGEFKLQVPRPFLIKRLKKQMLSIGAFGLVTGFSNIAIQQIDKLMLNDNFGLAEVGIYGVTFSFAILILFPSRAVKKISTIVIAESWKNKDLENIKTIYVKSTITLLILGTYVFLGLWGNIDNIIKILGPEYELGRYVIFFIGITNLLIMLSGVSFEIISTSKHYKYASIFMIMMLILIVLTNLLFIPIFGLVGAAIASMVATLIFVLIRFAFVWQKFKLQPYNYKHLIIIGIVLITYLLTFLLPSLENPYFDVIIKGSFITLIFSTLIYTSKVSEDLNEKADQVIRRFIYKKYKTN